MIGSVCGNVVWEVSFAISFDLLAIGVDSSLGPRPYYRVLQLVLRFQARVPNKCSGISTGSKLIGLGVSAGSADYADSKEGSFRRNLYVLCSNALYTINSFFFVFFLIYIYIYINIIHTHMFCRDLV